MVNMKNKCLWNGALTWRLIVSELVKAFFAVIEPEVSFRCSGEPTTGPFSGPNKFIPAYEVALHF